MDYEKAYKESFGVAKCLHETGDTTTKKQMERLFPQLRESEDERIRKKLIEIIGYFRSRGIDQQLCEKFLAYLERQKEPHFTKRNALFDKCVENCDPATMKRVSDEVDEILEKEQKPVQSDVEKEYIRTIKGIIADFIRDKKPEDVTFYQQIVDWLDGRHIEQKPVECIDFDIEFENQVSHLLASVLNGEHEYNESFVKYAAQSLLGYAKNEMKPDEWDKREKLFTKALQTANAQIGQLFEENKKLKEQQPEKKQDYSSLTDFERAIHRGFLSAGVENAPVTIIKETAQECLAQMKPAEWSEEDEDMLNSCISSIEEAKENRYAYKETDGDTSYDHEIAWLKLLRNRVGKEFLQPHWKPSREQMKTLRKYVMGDWRDFTIGPDKILTSLYNDLKKL